MLSTSNCRNSASVKIRLVAGAGAGNTRLGAGGVVGNSMVRRPPSAVMAQRLKALGVTVDAAAKLGVVREWLVVGPFADPDESGYATPFPPEKEFDPKASYDGAVA